MTAATASLALAASCASVIGADFDHGAGSEVADATANGANGANGGTADASGSPTVTVTLADGAVVTVLPDGGESSVVPSGGDGGNGGNGDDGADAAPTQMAGDDSSSASCTRTTVQTGDLRVTEMMLSADVDASDDYGQWIEIQNVSGCSLAVGGLTIIVPPSIRSDSSTATVPANVVLAPGERFVVADSIMPARNHNLPGLVYSWGLSNVLVDSDFVEIRMGSTILEQFEFAFNNCDTNETPCYHSNHSVEFPPDCDAAVIENTNYWVESESPWPDSGSYTGTPNAPNPVSCPIVEN